MADVKSIVAAIVGFLVVVIVAVIALSSRGKMLQMVIERRYGARRRRHCNRTCCAHTNNFSDQECHSTLTGPACSHEREPSIEVELPKYEPPPPAYLPPKLIIHNESLR
ncbi:hypothetical protein COEREDRAFT_7279 [Coemansia reversa NRRL 1564]|uniref:Uncharacterized protein n=1 Tax=Coemansia reversa (strain ATCC 12441 / NRRL 1564) TaxID=763665 RepID=A0A2G5BFC0_COERN|nr:hypothetical protein COEREDRAFT_7279 [Coemansia reversa NRRL 1564]|eukprot:PIA17682.1 hypothetical protein COEREDRAFT_7279 [Coemansia reversa NRRL 1564]